MLADDPIVRFEQTIHTRFDMAPFVNAGAFGMDKPFIVINSAALTLLDEDEQRVLLGLGEAVHLVDEQHRAPPAHGQSIPCLIDDGPHVLHSCGDSAQLDERPSAAGRQE